MKTKKMKTVPESALEEYKNVIGQIVTVTMDRPIGSRHPKHPEVVYPINYGYVEGLLGGDGEEQDVYVLGVDEPLATFTGKVIAVVHRFDDDECKWVAANGDYSSSEIASLVNFQERFHDSVIIK